MATAAHSLTPIRNLESVGDKAYDNWSACLETYLLSQDLWDLIESSPETTATPQSNAATDDGDGEIIASTGAVPDDASAAWRRRNAAALLAIQISLGSDLLHEIRKLRSAKEAWDALADMHQQQVNAGKINGMEQRMMNNRDGVSRYFALLIYVHKGDVGGLREFIAEYPESIRFKFPRALGTALHRVANSGRTEIVKEMVEWADENNLAIQDPTGLTALHLAAYLGETEIVKEMMELADEDDLAIQDDTGFTALHFAASCGHRRIAELMVAKNRNLVTMLDNNKMIPLREACWKNHKQLATFLYRATPFRWLCEENGGKYGANILKCCILRQMFDIALDMVTRCPSMAVTMDADGWNAAIQLASMPAAFPSGGEVPFLFRWVYPLIRVRLPGPLLSSRIDDDDEDDDEEEEVVGPMGPPSDYDVKIDTGKLSGKAKSRFGMTASSEGRRIRSQRRRQDGGDENWCHRLLIFVLKVTGIQHIYDLKRAHICSLKLLERTCRHISRLDFDKLEGAGLYEAFHNAMKNGIVEFVMMAIKACPLLYKYEKNGRNMFMLVVEFRQKKIFNLMYPLPNRATTVSLVDKKKNTLLHMAGMLSPSANLSHISGAALRMQRELQWFQEVERVIDPTFKDNTNNDNETARQIFTRTHKDLAAAGEKWMKETASSSTVVAALIITIMFTAAFTVPGGNNQETGIPILLHDRSFQTFMVADAISLFSASTSVLMFLGILTSRYAEDDFLRSLPTKLVIGLSSLFVSIAAMMVAFSASVMIVMDRRLEYVAPIMLMAGVPVTLFMMLQFPLPVEIFRSTYGSWR